MNWKREYPPGYAKALDRACREKMKKELLKDIRIEIEVCKLEGWDFMEYIRELAEILDHFIKLWETEKEKSLKPESS